MSDWIPRSKISPPPWVISKLDESQSEPESDPAALMLSDESSGGISSSSEGMLLGIGMSLGFVAIVATSYVATRW